MIGTVLNSAVHALTVTQASWHLCSVRCILVVMSALFQSEIMLCKLLDNEIKTDVIVCFMEVHQNCKDCLH